MASAVPMGPNVPGPEQHPLHKPLRVPGTALDMLVCEEEENGFVFTHILMQLGVNAWNLFKNTPGKRREDRGSRWWEIAG